MDDVVGVLLLTVAYKYLQYVKFFLCKHL